VVVNKELGYYTDDTHGLLYIPILRAGSRSAHTAMKPWHRELNREQALEANRSYPGFCTVAFVRHPWDRIVSALYGPLMDLGSFQERIDRHILGRTPIEIDSHLRPQSFVIRDLRIDHLVKLDSIHPDWAIVQNLYPHLRDFPCKHVTPNRPEGWKWYDRWDELMDLYKGDFALCPDWEH